VSEQATAAGPADLSVIDDPATVATVLEPTRARVLAALSEPGSATTVAAGLGLTRQQVNYHLRALQAQGLVVEVGTRPRRGLTERVVRATARGYVVSPAVLGVLAAEPARTDRLSARYLIAVASRVVREVAALVRAASAAGQQLPTLTIDTDLRFASAADRAAFTSELADVVRRLAARYHDEQAEGGRWHRLLVAAYPKPAETAEPAETADPAAAPAAAPSPTPAPEPTTETDQTESAKPPEPTSETDLTTPTDHVDPSEEKPT
jgi:predicted ArsR family transcriptional regulator